jgi:hypothetical protein
MVKLISFLTFEFLFVFLLAYWNRKYNNNRLTNFLIALFSTIIFYISIIVMMITIRLLMKIEHDSFDLDGNGFITGEEVTPASIESNRNAVHDTGLSMAPFTGILFSIIYFILIIIPLAISNRRKKSNTKITE